jgi:hypothetical protein
VQVGEVSKQFTVDIVLEDPCSDPTIIVPETTTLTYTITDGEVKYTLSPQFSVTPDFCPYEITFTVGEDGDEIVIFDPDTQEIIIPEIPDDLTPSNPNDDDSTDHTYPVTIEIVVKDDEDNETSDDVVIPVIIQNPCIDPEYVSIELPASLADLQYMIDSGAVTYDAIAVGDDAIFVKTNPVHSLCGNIKITILYENTPNDESVLTFDETNLEFTAESTDGNLVDQTKSY